MDNSNTDLTKVRNTRVCAYPRVTALPYAWQIRGSLLSLGTRQEHNRSLNGRRFCFLWFDAVQIGNPTEAFYKMLNSCCTADCVSSASQIKAVSRWRNNYFIPAVASNRWHARPSVPMRKQSVHCRVCATARELYASNAVNITKSTLHLRYDSPSAVTFNLCATAIFVAALLEIKLPV